VTQVWQAVLVYWGDLAQADICRMRDAQREVAENMAPTGQGVNESRSGGVEESTDRGVEARSQGAGSQGASSSSAPIGIVSSSSLTGAGGEGVKELRSRSRSRARWAATAESQYETLFDCSVVDVSSSEDEGMPWSTLGAEFDNAVRFEESLKEKPWSTLGAEFDNAVRFEESLKEKLQPVDRASASSSAQSTELQPVRGVAQGEVLPKPKCAVDRASASSVRESDSFQAGDWYCHSCGSRQSNAPISCVGWGLLCRECRGSD
jgi:hypothetical protein